MISIASERLLWSNIGRSAMSSHCRIKLFVWLDKVISSKSIACNRDAMFQRYTNQLHVVY